MTIPGYGEGVAADVGGGITGAHIDVWIASCSDAVVLHAHGHDYLLVARNYVIRRPGRA